MTRKKTVPDSQIALNAAAELDLAALGLRGKARDLGGAGAPERDLAARPPARRASAARVAEAPAPRRARHATSRPCLPGPVPARSRASNATRSRSAASSPSSARVSAMFRSVSGLSSASAGRTSARMRLRAKGGSAFVSSSANGRPAAVASARVSSRERARSGRITRPGARAHAQESAGPRRLREAVDDGLGDVGAGVAGGDPADAEAGTEALGGEVAGGPGGGLKVAGSQLASASTRST